MLTSPVQALPEQALSPRPRVCSLLQKAVDQYTITMVTAGPGAGKTTATRQFAEACGHACLWLDVMRLDNQDDRLWRRTLEGIAQVLPEMKEAIHSMLGLPLAASMDMFLSAWRLWIADDAKLLIVYDRAEYLQLEEAYRFILYLNDANLRNLSVVLIKTPLAGQEQREQLLYGNVGELTPKELYFTAKEVSRLLEARNVLHTGNQVDRIMEATGGWPFGVDSCVLQLANRTPLPTDADFDDAECLRLLHQLWVSPYDMWIRQKLATLSTLPVFASEHLRFICDEEEIRALLQTLLNNPFVHFSTRFRLFIFEPMYARSLQMEADLQCLDKPHEISSRGWDWFLERRELREALARYAEEGHEEASFDRMNASGRINAFLHAGAISRNKAYWKENPRNCLLYARLLAEEHRHDEALTWLEEALDTCVQRDRERTETQQLLGEIYLGIAHVHLHLVRPRGITYLQKAYDLLPHGSAMGQSGEWLLPNESTLSIMPTKPDDLHKAVQAYAKAEAIMGNGLAGPHVRGFLKLFSAEVALATYDLAKATSDTNEALLIGQLHEQHTLVCNAYVLAARIALLRGNGKDLVETLTKLDEYIRERHLVRQQRTCDFLISWVSMQTGYMDPVPTAFRNPFIFDEMPRHGLTCREMLLECGYAVYAGEHMQALRMIAQARQFAAGRKQFEVQINLYILEAYCYIREDQVEKGIQAFTAAYNMAHPIGILSSLIEGGQAMRTLIQTIRRTGNHGLDEAWLDTVAGKATTYAKRCNAILQQMNCQSRSKPVTFRLSSREKETLNLLSEGMSREEIGEQMGITIHGVKRHLTSLYEKLGATSRSDAVIRAEAMGLFQQKQPAYQDDMT